MGGRPFGCHERSARLDLFLGLRHTARSAAPIVCTSAQIQTFSHSFFFSFHSLAESSAPLENKPRMTVPEGKNCLRGWGWGWVKRGV